MIDTLGTAGTGSASSVTIGDAEGLGLTAKPASLTVAVVPLRLILRGRNPRTYRRANPDVRVDNGEVADLVGADEEESDHDLEVQTHSLQQGNEGGPDHDTRSLDGLARSLGDESKPRLAGLPLLEALPDGRFRLCAGERRVEAARLRGWRNITCLIHSGMDSLLAHTLGLVENLHRLPMHPLDEAAALRVSYLLANSASLNLESAAGALLEEAWDQNLSQSTLIEALSRLLLENGWQADRPAVTWKAHLDDLGLDMQPWERKRKLRLLNIDTALHDRLRKIPITEAALRSIGTLLTATQGEFVTALESGRLPVRRVRRLARALNTGIYSSFEEAMVEIPSKSPSLVSGNGYAIPLATMRPGSNHATSSSEDDSELDQGIDGLSARVDTGVPTRSDSSSQVFEPNLDEQDAVLQILDCAKSVSTALRVLQPRLRGASLPEPWGTWAAEALASIKTSLADQA